MVVFESVLSNSKRSNPGSKNDSFKALRVNVMPDISARHNLTISVQIKQYIHLAVQTKLHI